MQLFVLFITDATALTAVTSLAGAFYVSALVFKKKIAFLAAMIFNAGTLFIGVSHGVFSELFQQPMFFLVNLIGFLTVMQFKGTSGLDRKLKSTVNKWSIPIVLLVSVIVIFGWMFISRELGSHVWIKDGIIGGISIVAQVLSIVENEASWYGWIALNVFSMWTWFSVGSAVMGGLYVLFLVNAFFGLYFWLKFKKEKRTFISDI